MMSLALHFLRLSETKHRSPECGAYFMPLGRFRDSCHNILCSLYHLFFSPGKAGRLHFPDSYIQLGLKECVPKRSMSLLGQTYTKSAMHQPPCLLPSCCDTGDHVRRQVASPGRSLHP